MDKHLGTARATRRLADRALRSGRRLRGGLWSILAVAMIALGLPLLTMTAASAHTPDATASCVGGVTVTGTAYDATDANLLGVQLDGGTWITKSFGSSGTLTVPVPQNDGKAHTWKAYVHTSNPNTSYSHDYSGTVGPCGTKHVTAVLWDKTPPTCTADGALVTKTEPDGVIVTRNPASGTGPGTYTISFSPKPGFAIDGTTSQTITVAPKLTGDQCATVVQPVPPTITNPTCTGPGAGSAGTFNLPADGGGISYTRSGNVVTATADATHKFGTLPTGWSAVDAHHATFTVTYTSPTGYPACLEQLPTPVPPVASAPTCDTDGDLVVGTTAHVVTRVDGNVVVSETHVGAGAHQLSYTADAGYTFAGGTTKTFPVQVGSKTLDCPVTPVNPDVTQSVCNGPGTHTEPVVTAAVTEHVSYQYDAATHVLTATPAPGFALANLPAGWTAHDGGTATYLVTLADPGACLEEVAVPTPPVPTVPTCSLDGSLTVAPTAHVVTTVDGTVVDKVTSFGPGMHTVAYAPAAGYTFTGDVVTSTPVTVLPSTDDCPTSVVSPSVTQSVCTGNGTHSDPVVTAGDVAGDHVSYVYDAAGHVMTATPDTGFVLANLPAGWTLLGNGKATFTVSLTDPGACTVVVSPPTVNPVVAGPHGNPSVLPNTGAPDNLALLTAEALVLLLAGAGLLIWRRRTQ